MCRIRLKSGLASYPTGGAHLGIAGMGLCDMVPKMHLVLKLSHRPDHCSAHYPAVSHNDATDNARLHMSVFYTLSHLCRSTAIAFRPHIAKSLAAKWPSPVARRTTASTMNQSFQRVPDSTLLEEELLPGYTAEDYYPVIIG